MKSYGNDKNPIKWILEPYENDKNSIKWILESQEIAVVEEN